MREAGEELTSGLEMVEEAIETIAMQNTSIDNVTMHSFAQRLLAAGAKLKVLEAWLELFGCKFEIRIPKTELFGERLQRPKIHEFVEEKFLADVRKLLDADLDEGIDRPPATHSISKPRARKESMNEQSSSADNTEGHESDEELRPRGSGGRKRMISDTSEDEELETPQRKSCGSKIHDSVEEGEQEDEEEGEMDYEEGEESDPLELSEDEAAMLNMSTKLPFDKPSSRVTRQTANLLSSRKRAVVEDSDDDDADYEFRTSDPYRSNNPLRKRNKMPRLESPECIDLGDDDDDLVEVPVSESSQKKKKKSKTTLEAEREEANRIQRLVEKQRLFNGIELDKGATNLTQAYSQIAPSPPVKKITLDLDLGSKPPEPVVVHPSLVCKLKSHQADGIKFLYDCTIEDIRRLGFPGSGGLLSHVMGLGKTFQTIAFLHTIMTHPKISKKINKVIIFCPRNVLMNWCSEFRKWLRDNDRVLDVIQVFHLLDDKTQAARLQRLRNWKNCKKPSCLVVNYEVFRNYTQDYPVRDKKGISKKKMTEAQKRIVKDQPEFRSLLRNPGADLVVLDEGHVLKNPKTALSIAMKEIETRRRVILSGTPMQNNLLEYHTMIDFIKPNLLGNLEEFKEKFYKPIEGGKTKDADCEAVYRMKKFSHILNKKLHKVLHRKDYSTLAESMPMKFEYVVSCHLTEQQITMYKYYMEFVEPAVKIKPIYRVVYHHHAVNRFCTHPYLMIEHHKEQERKAERKGLNEFVQQDESGDDDESNITEIVPDRGFEGPGDWFTPNGFVSEDDRENFSLSNKLMILLEIIKKCEEIGDKILVFSQSLDHLALIQRALEKLAPRWFEDHEPLKRTDERWGWKINSDFMIITGNVQVQERDTIQKRFNDPSNQRARVCLISTKAGGLGTNFVGANRVILFDACWNPTIDQQALFRAYRFGQVKPVYVYRLVAVGMESNIYNRQITKQSIAQRVIDEKQNKRHYTNADLEEMFRVPDEHYDPNEPVKYAPPADRLLAEVFHQMPHAVANCWTHDTLLMDDVTEQLSEEDRKAAWDEYERGRKNVNGMSALTQPQKAFLIPVRELAQSTMESITSSDKEWIETLLEQGMDQTEAISLVLMKAIFLELYQHVPMNLKSAFADLERPVDLIEEMIKSAHPTSGDIGLDTLLECQKKFCDLYRKLGKTQQFDGVFEDLEARLNCSLRDPPPNLGATTVKQPNSTVPQPTAQSTAG